MFKDFIYNTQTNEKIIYLFLFFFPIAGPVVRHWNSLWFMLIFFFAIYFLITSKNRKRLLPEEKILISAFSLFFISFLISANLNGWNKFQTYELGNELRFLLFFPIYLLIREYEFSLKSLFAGLLLCIPVIFLFSLYEYIYVVQPIQGAYSVLFIGPITAMSLMFYQEAYKKWFNNNRYIWLVYISFLMGILIVAFSYARTAYLTLLIGIIALIFLYAKKIKHIFLYIIVVVTVILGLLNNLQVNNRVMLAIDNVKQYYIQSDINSPARTTSLGVRLEMWRASKYAIKEHPVFGLAPRNFPEFIKPYIQRGYVGSEVKVAGTLHNTFVEVVVSKGLFGLFLLIILFYYPVYVAWQNRQRCESCFRIIFLFSLSLTTISMGLSNLVNKNNAVSYLIIFTAIFFAHMMRTLYPNHFKSGS